MSDGSTIEWLSWPGYRPASWNPARDCTGQVRLYEANLLLPLKWRAPRCTFVNSTSDLFHERLPDEAIDRVFAVMALCPQHLFICTTKMAERMREYFDRCSKPDPDGFVAEDIRVALTTISQTPSRRERCPALKKIPLGKFCQQIAWPLPNVVLGVSVEDQATADERIPHLLATPAACRMVSAEPLLSAVTLFEHDEFDDKWVGPGVISDVVRQPGTPNEPEEWIDGSYPGIDWVITGGESGHDARPAHPEWFRSIRDQCRAANVAYFHKQNGEWAPGGPPRTGVLLPRPISLALDGTYQDIHALPRNTAIKIGNGEVLMARVGKYRAGRLLDGRTHDEFPETSR